MMLEWTTILSPVVNAFSEESVISSIGIVQAITGVIVRLSSTPSRRTNTRIGPSPLWRTKRRIQSAVSELGTASLLNVKRWSPGLMPPAAAGEVSATDRTVACVQLTESASWEYDRNLRDRLGTVPASRPICADRFLQSRCL